MITRICLDCSLKTPCFRDQMYHHILKIPTEKMIEIVSKYDLVKYPQVLQRRTLANLICDYTIEGTANKILNGDEKE
ncbi:MAG: hypothetical protein ISR80_05935 [Nitrosopumilus sp.]|nr:hypothetical protein [Nitrosopumilus sp.]